MLEGRHGRCLHLNSSTMTLLVLLLCMASILNVRLQQTKTYKQDKAMHRGSDATFRAKDSLEVYNSLTNLHSPIETFKMTRGHRIQNDLVRDFLAKNRFATNPHDLNESVHRAVEPRISGRVSAVDFNAFVSGRSRSFPQTWLSRTARLQRDVRAFRDSVPGQNKGAVRGNQTLGRNALTLRGYLSKSVWPDRRQEVRSAAQTSAAQIDTASGPTEAGAFSASQVYSNSALAENVGKGLPVSHRYLTPNNHSPGRETQDDQSVSSNSSILSAFASSRSKNLNTLFASRRSGLCVQQAVLCQENLEVRRIFREFRARRQREKEKRGQSAQTEVRATNDLQGRDEQKDESHRAKGSDVHFRNGVPSGLHTTRNSGQMSVRLKSAQGFRGCNRPVRLAVSPGLYTYHGGKDPYLTQIAVSQCKSFCEVVPDDTKGYAYDVHVGNLFPEHNEHTSRSGVLMAAVNLEAWGYAHGTPDRSDIYVGFHSASDVQVSYAYFMHKFSPCARSWDESCQERTKDAPFWSWCKAAHQSDHVKCLLDVVPGLWASLKPVKISYAKESLLAAFVSATCDRHGEYLKRLMEHMVVHMYGGCHNNRDERDAEASRVWEQAPPGMKTKSKDLRPVSKLLVARQYKFYLSVENTIIDDYVTEKFYCGFQMDNVMVYLGAPNAYLYAPAPNSFINALDFDGPKELAEYLRYVADNKEVYESFLAWRKPMVVQQSFYKIMRLNFEQMDNTSFLCRTCSAALTMKGCPAPEGAYIGGSLLDPA